MYRLQMKWGFNENKCKILTLNHSQNTRNTNRQRSVEEGSAIKVAAWQVTKNVAQNSRRTQRPAHPSSQQATLSQVVLFMAQFPSVCGLSLFTEQA
jgi:hypothetical protein